MAEKTNIYILRLEGGKYYVGKSSNVVERFQQHLSGSGSAWTKKYKPVQLLRTITNASPFEEDRYVKEYMSKFGIDNVRGGAYVEVELSEFHTEALKMELWAATDKCTTCGRAGHWAKDCYAKKDVSGNEIQSESESETSNIWGCDHCEREFSDQEQCEKHERYCSRKKIGGRGVAAARGGGACYRCGRTGHYSPDCYARSHKNGYDLSDDDDDSD